jgi:hypothetical protein
LLAPALLCSVELVRRSKQAVGQRCAGAEGRRGGRFRIFLVALADESTATTRSSHTARVATKSLSSLRASEHWRRRLRASECWRDGRGSWGRGLGKRLKEPLCLRGI